MAIQRFGSFLDERRPTNFSNMLDRFFNETVNQHQKLADFTPHVDTCETENGYEIELALPGLRKEDIKIEFQEGRLTISGERKLRNENKDKRYHLIESQYGSFTRSFQLPNNIDPASIDAAFQDGILHVNIPKNTQETKRQQIQIKDGAVDKKNQQLNQQQASGNGNGKQDQGQNKDPMNKDEAHKKEKAGSKAAQ